jgi:hypothetical protein
MTCAPETDYNSLHDNNCGDIDFDDANSNWFVMDYHIEDPNPNQLEHN